MQNRNLAEGLRKSFDNAIIVINEMTAEAAELKQKFGERSRLLEKKVAQIETLRAFYKISKSTIDSLIARNSKLGAQLVGAEIMVAQKMHNLNFEQAAKLLNYEFTPEMIQAQNDLDKIIAALVKPAPFNG